MIFSKCEITGRHFSLAIIGTHSGHWIRNVYLIPRWTSFRLNYTVQRGPAFVGPPLDCVTQPKRVQQSLDRSQKVLRVHLHLKQTIHSTDRPSNELTLKTTLLPTGFSNMFPTFSMDFRFRLCHYHACWTIAQQFSPGQISCMKQLSSAGKKLNIAGRTWNGNIQKKPNCSAIPRYLLCTKRTCPQPRADCIVVTRISGSTASYCSC